MYIIYESLGKHKPGKRKKKVRIWNKETDQAVKEKLQAYLQNLRHRTDETQSEKHNKRNRPKTLI